METQGNDIATQFAAISGEFIATVEGLSESDLAKQCVAEQCTVAALASHMANVFGSQVDWVQDIVAGRPLPEITMADIHQNNARQAAINAHLGKDAVLECLRTRRDKMLTILQGLQDDEAERTAPFSLMGGQPVSVQTLVDLGLIAHTKEHLASLRASAANAVAPSSPAES